MPSLELHRPTSPQDAVDALGAGGERRILAGGQSLVPLLTLGLASVDALVSLDRCAGLDGTDIGSDHATIGATVTTRRVELDHGIASAVPLMAAAAGRVGSPHVRNFGTLVGNLCHADPGSDLIPAALCLEAEVEALSVRGARHLRIDELIGGPFTTSLLPDEMATAVRIPIQEQAWRYSYRKLVKRAGDLAMATAAVMVRMTGGVVVEARLAIGGPLPRAERVRDLEAGMVGAGGDDAVALTLSGGWVHNLAGDLLSDPTLPVDYLRAMLPRFAAATLQEALRGRAN